MGSVITNGAPLLGYRLERDRVGGGELLRGGASLFSPDGWAFTEAFVVAVVYKAGVVFELFVLSTSLAPRRMTTTCSIGTTILMLSLSSLSSDSGDAIAASSFLAGLGGAKAPADSSMSSV